MDTQLVLFIFTLMSPRSHSESATDDETGEETYKLTSPAVIIVNAQCMVAGEEADEFSISHARR